MKLTKPNIPERADNDVNPLGESGDVLVDLDAQGNVRHDDQTSEGWYFPQGGRTDAGPNARQSRSPEARSTGRESKSPEIQAERKPNKPATVESGDPSKMQNFVRWLRDEAERTRKKGDLENAIKLRKLANEVLSVASALNYR